MGLSDLFSDVISSMGFGEAMAEAPPAEPEPESPAQETESEKHTVEAEEQPAAEESSEEEAGGDEGEEKGGDEEEGGEEEQEEEEEEEEEEEVEDIKPKLEEDCAHSAHCAPFKHHFDECVERVTHQQEDPDYNGPKEDCVEEFFHLQHCAAECAAPKLWKTLK